MQHDLRGIHKETPTVCFHGFIVEIGYHGPVKLRAKQSTTAHHLHVIGECSEHSICDECSESIVSETKSAQNP